MLLVQFFYFLCNETNTERNYYFFSGTLHSCSVYDPMAYGG